VLLATPAAANQPAAPLRSVTIDLLLATYAPHTNPDDPLAFPMKLRNLAQDPYRFWRGSKEHFFDWSRTHAADWLADQPAYLIIHGDLHPGNFGVYLAAGKFGKSLGVGPFDFDETARLPFQFELLQGAIMLELLAQDKEIPRTDDHRNKILALMFEAYRTALDSNKTPTDLLSTDPWIEPALEATRNNRYTKEVTKYVTDDAFPLHPDKSGKPKEFQRPVEGNEKFAKAINDALISATEPTDLLPKRSLRKNPVIAAALRTSLESAGSEGLAKYLVLLDEKSAPKNRLLITLRQQVPPTAERVGLIPKDPRPAAQRSVEQSRALLAPPEYLAGWCIMDGHSFRLSIKEPWTDSIDAASKIKSQADLEHLARLWGTLAGAIHGHQQDSRTALRERLTPELLAALQIRSTAYRAALATEFTTFLQDPRRIQPVRRAQAALEALVK